MNQRPQLVVCATTRTHLSVYTHTEVYTVKSMSAHTHIAHVHMLRFYVIMVCARLVPDRAHTCVMHAHCGAHIDMFAQTQNYTAAHLL